MVDFLCHLPLSRDRLDITLLHVFRKPSAGEKLMGEEYIREAPARLKSVLEKAKNRLVENGFDPDRISIRLITDEYTTITDGIIDQYRKKTFDMVVIGRRKKSKSEEFVLGDISVNLVRALEKAAVMVVKI
mgnify:CR=1 FL=1